jgi:hypothetical protein
MGIDLLLNIVAIDHRRRPDWEAAESRIATLEPGDLRQYFAYWNPGEPWEADGDPDVLERMRVDLLENLADVKAAYSGYHREATSFDYDGRRFFVTGGLSVGDVPTSLYDPVSTLASVGALQAAGFDLVHVDVGAVEEQT